MKKHLKKKTRERKSLKNKWKNRKGNKNLKKEWKRKGVAVTGKIYNKTCANK